MKQEIQEELVRQIQQEVEYQLRENDKHEDDYRKASEYHTRYIQLLNEDATKYPHFIMNILQEHIVEEEKIVGVDTIEGDLNQYEKGRIYSLVRCKHMIRVATEIASR